MKRVLHLPSAKPSGRRSLTPGAVAVWLGLLLFFVAYEFDVPAGFAPLVREIGVGRILGVLFVGWVAAVIVGQVFALRRFAVENQVAVEMLAAGETEAARDRFGALVERWRRPKSVQAVALFNFGWTCLRSGELHPAMDAFARFEREHRNHRTLAALTPAHLATAYAIAGELDAASAWIDEAVRRSRPGVDDTRGRDVILAGARAILDCRRGKAAEAAAALAAGWRRIENSASGDILRPLRVVRAFALEASGGAENANAVDQALAPVRDAQPDEFAYLAVEWPEMRAFLARHAL